MRFLRAIGVFLLAQFLAACGPMSAVGMIGSSVVKTISNYNEREAVEAPRRAAVAKANLDLGVEYLRRKEYENALARLQRAREADPAYAPIYSVFGLLYQNLGEYELAEANFRKSLRLDARDSDTLNNYGQFLCERGRHAEAEELFLNAAGNPLYKSPETPYANAGTCAYLNHDIANAVGYFKQALSRNPRIPIALISMSEIEYGNQNYAAADKYLERYLGVATQNARSIWLGIRIKRQLRDENAVASYTLLLRNNFPDSEEATHLEEFLTSQPMLAMERPVEMKQSQLLHDFESFGEPELLMEMQLLRDPGN